MKDLGNSMIEILRTMSEMHDEIQASNVEIALEVLGVGIILVAWMLWGCLIMNLDLEEKRKKKLRERGLYNLEFPMKHIEVRKADIYNEAKGRRKKQKRALTLACVIKKKFTSKLSESISSVQANRRKRDIIRTDTMRRLTEGEVCLLVRSSGIHKKRDKGEIMPNEERVRSFRLDVSYSWERKKNDEWLWAQNMVINNAGQIIAVRGISEETAAKGYDIYIPKAGEKEIAAMSLTEMLKFCDAKNCKLQIKERGKVFIFSNARGFKKKDVIKAMKEAAERQGIKLKRR